MSWGTQEQKGDLVKMGLEAGIDFFKSMTADSNRIKDEAKENIKNIIGVMESMLAPTGSKLIIHSEDEHLPTRTIDFGLHQGLGLYLNGKDLDKSIYENYDVNFVYEEIERLLGDFQTGHIASHWEGETTAFYLYGENFEEMHKRIKPLLDEYPLCQQCKVVKIA